MTENLTAAAPAIDPSLYIKSYRLVRQSQCPKLGAFSSGLITYQLLTDEGGTELFLRIASNDGGGYVSDEAVPFAKVVRCVNEHDPDKPMRSTDFREAFVGLSNNNWGFLAAILLHEQLLSRHPAQPHLLLDAGGWGAWGAARLAEAGGELATVQVGKLPRSIGVRKPAAVPADAHAPEVDPPVEAEAPAAPPAASAEPRHARQRRK